MAQPQANNPRLVSVVWFAVLPPQFGGQKAVAFFNRHLSAHAPLLCLCSHNNKSAAENYAVLNDLPVGKAQFLNPFVWRKIYRTAKRQKATHLLLEFPYHGIAGVLCKKFLGTKLVVRSHNLEYRRFAEQGKQGWPLLFWLEKFTLKNADLVFFKTVEDLGEAKKKFGLRADKLCVLPYGVQASGTVDRQKAGETLRKQFGIQPEEKILLFAGTLDYSPNADAVMAIHQKLIPLLDQLAFRYKIIVCGRNRFAEFQYLNQVKNDKLLMAGEVENIDKVFSGADVFINPVLSGGGVQTKNIDALSHHLNLVCFASKMRGMAPAPEKTFVVPDNNWQAFAEAIIAASQTFLPTPATFFETHNWRTIAAKAYQKILAC